MRQYEKTGQGSVMLLRVRLIIIKNEKAKRGLKMPPFIIHVITER